MPTTLKYALTSLAFCTACMGTAESDVAEITIDAGKPGHRISRLLTGACIEDVNHEIYGGLYSQMIFGESFQEPAPVPPPKGFQVFDGEWGVWNGEIQGGPGNGPKAILDDSLIKNGEISVEVFFADRAPGNAGLIVCVSEPAVGANGFIGYEVALEPAAQILRLGRHRHNWELIKDTPCEVPVAQWITLTVTLDGTSIEVSVNGKSVVRHDDGSNALPAGAVGLRQWQRTAAYRNLRLTTGGQTRTIPFESAAPIPAEISRMWQLVQRGTAAGTCGVERDRCFVGAQSQRITFKEGQGQWGIANMGLNRWGLDFVQGRPYEGILWARTETPTEIWIAIENADGSKTVAETRLKVESPEWTRIEFSLTPSAAIEKGRLAILLRQPGSVCLGYAFLQPGEWGRYKGLPIRRDVVEGLVDQGITLLRYGGSMINHREYRWKKMIGPRDRRPPYCGTWYPYSTNGWGIIDFMNFCEAAGFEYIPAFNMDETPQDMADFVEYAKGARDSEWGRKRVADGHPEPFALRYIQLGNEERVDDKYFQRFVPLAEAIWAKDPEITVVVGDFIYAKPIRDPFSFEGHPLGLTTLETHRKILELARERKHEVWFDIHVGTDGPHPDSTFDGMFSFIDALEKLVPDAPFKVAVFEFNSANHTHRRGLANALAINAIERDSRIPVACSANCLQVDGQNDNDWDQGLLFLNQSHVWLQSPGWVTRMVSRHYQPLSLPATVSGVELDVSAKRSEDGKIVVVQVVNVNDKPVPARIKIENFAPSAATAAVEELSAPLDTVNTVAEPLRLVPRQSQWLCPAKGESMSCTFAPFSFTVVEFE